MWRHRPRILWHGKVTWILWNGNITADRNCWSRWRRPPHFPARQPKEMNWMTKWNDYFGAQAVTRDDGCLPPQHSPMTWARLQRLWQREEAWLPGLCLFKSKWDDCDLLCREKAWHSSRHHHRNEARSLLVQRPDGLNFETFRTLKHRTENITQDSRRLSP